MTKLRAALSHHHATRLVIERIGLSGVARHAGCRPGTLTDWTDPARGKHLPHAAALRFDSAFLADGGGYPPIGTAYMAELRVAAAAAFHGGAARAELSARAAIEAGEASAATLQAYVGPGGAAALLAAERETEEVIAAYAAQLHDIRRQLAVHGVERGW